MKRRLVLTLTILLFFVSPLWAETYKIAVTSADDMSVQDNVVTLSGKVELTFSTDDENNSKVDRVLTCSKAIIDTDAKILEARGSVFLKEGEDSTFKGEVLVLNWDDLDVIVFGGESSSDRNNSSGNSFTFYAKGQSISYNGQESVVFFKNGTIATTRDDPFWSIKAKKIGLAESDLFFSNAVIRLGRVPIFWLPVFFYPGTTLIFNPAIGFSSSKGMFINTTTEIYGRYPATQSTTVSSNESDSGSSASSAGNAMASISSLLNDGDDSEKIRDGVIYRKLKRNEELPKFEKWARESGSYFAFTADLYQDQGLALGLDTKNSLFNGKLKINADAMAAYHKTSGTKTFKERLRYAADLDISGNFSNGNISLQMPFLSDPNFKVDYFNRNTVFGLDSLLGRKQIFPSIYTTDMSKYNWTLDSSANVSVGSHKFVLNSLKSDIRYEWNTAEKKFEAAAVTLPYASISISGTIFEIKGSDIEKDVRHRFPLKAANDFYDEYLEICETDKTDETKETDEAGMSEETSVSDKITEVADSLSSEVSPNPESAENSVSKGENPDSEAVAVTPLNDKGEESGKNPESEVLTDKDAVSEKVPEEVPASEASGTSSELQSAEEQGEDTNAIADLEPFKVENFTDIKKRKLEAGYLKASYSYSQKLDNNYKKNFTEGSFYTKLDGNLVIDGKVPGQFFSAKETISPSFDITKKVEGNSDVKNGSLTSNFTASVPLVGITYTLTNKVVNYKNDNGNKEVKKWDWTSENVTAHSIAISKTLGPFTLSLKQNLKPVTETLVPSVTFNHKSGFYIFADLAFKRDDSDKLVREKSNANFKFSRNNIDFKFTKASLEISFYNSYDHQKKWESYSGTQRFYFSLFNSNLSFTENLSLEKEFKVKSMSLNLAAWGNSVTMTFKDVDFTPDTLKVLLKYNLKPVYGWKNRIGFEGGFDASFTYDFNNKYGTTFMLNFSLAFAISKFLDIDVSVKTVNNSFYRYYDDGGKFSMSLLLQDLLRSFDFFGNGRRQTGFNLDSINISAVHYMEDWKLVFSLKANTVLQNSKYVFKPEITVYMQWNAIPELKVENKLKNGEWENK